MKRIVPWLFLSVVAFAATLSACTLPNGQPVNWPQTVECAPGVPDIVDSVSTALLQDGENPQTLSDRAKAVLEQLGRDHGTGVVACVVERLAHDWSAPGAAQDPVVVAAAQRGRAFLTEVGTQARLDEDSGGGS